MGSKELSADLRNRIVSKHRSGDGYGKVSAALKVPRRGPYLIIQVFKMIMVCEKEARS